VWDVEQTEDCLMNRISLEQLKRWMAYYRVEPFGDDWRRTGRLGTMVAAAVGATVKPEAEEMFMPHFDASQPTQTEAEMMAELMKLKDFQ